MAPLPRPSSLFIETSSKPSFFQEEEELLRDVQCFPKAGPRGENKGTVCCNLLLHYNIRRDRCCVVGGPLSFGWSRSLCVCHSSIPSLSSLSFSLSSLSFSLSSHPLRDQSAPSGWDKKAQSSHGREEAEAKLNLIHHFRLSLCALTDSPPLSPMTISRMRLFYT